MRLAISTTTVKPTWILGGDAQPDLAVGCYVIDFGEHLPAVLCRFLLTPPAIRSSSSNCAMTRSAWLLEDKLHSSHQARVLARSNEFLREAICFLEIATICQTCYEDCEKLWASAVSCTVPKALDLGCVLTLLLVMQHIPYLPLHIAESVLPQPCYLWDGYTIGGIWYDMATWYMV